MPKWLKKVAAFIWSIVKERLVTQPVPSPVSPVEPPAPAPVPVPTPPPPTPVPVPVPEPPIPLPPPQPPEPSQPLPAPIPGPLVSLVVDIVYRRWYGGEGWAGGGQTNAAPTANAGDGYGRAALSIEGRDAAGNSIDLSNAAPRACWEFYINNGEGAVILETINETEPRLTQNGYVPFDMDPGQYKQSRGQSCSMRFHPDMPAGTNIAGTVIWTRGSNVFGAHWRMKPSILGTPIPDNRKVTCPSCGNRQPDEGSNQKCAKCKTRIPTLWR